MLKSNLFLSVLAGLLMVISFPEIGNLAPLMLFAWVPLLFIEDSVSINKKSSFLVFAYSYLTFFIFNLGTTWWVWNASNGGAIGAILANSLLMSITFQLFHFVKKRVGKREGYIGFIFIWLAFEYVHLRWELSWPWLNLGNVFANMPEIVQWYSYSGVLGGSLWILFINLFIFRILKNVYVSKENWNIQTPIILAVAIGLIFPITFSLISYSTFEFKENPVNVIVTQPNINTYTEKFGDYETRTPMMPVKTQLDRCFEKDVNYAEADFILAPETAIPTNFDESTITKDRACQYLQNKVNNWNKPDLFIGASTSTITKERQNGAGKQVQDGFYTSYNTGILFRPNAKPSLNHKSKLVIGVEALPFSSTFSFIENWAISLGGASGSLGIPENLANQKGSKGVFAPMICYESVYGQVSADLTNKGAAFLAVITNDDWWLNTPGHRQHFAYSRLRAIENRRFVARSANTGISGFINARGDVISKSEYRTQDALQATIHLITEKTFYTKYGDFLGSVSAFVTIALMIFSVVTIFKRRKNIKR